MPSELVDHEPGFDDDGIQLTSTGITARRDAFLRHALDQLDPAPASLQDLDPNRL